MFAEKPINLPFEEDDNRVAAEKSDIVIIAVVAELPAVQGCHHEYEETHA